MRTLYHLWLSPFSRKVRIALAEKSLAFVLKAEKVWDRRNEFLTLNPAGEVPVLVDDDGSVVVDSTAICEYLEEVCPEPPLIPGTAVERAEVRRVALWFDNKFYREVTQHLLDEKIMKRFLGLGAPNSDAIRAGKANIHYHLDYVAYLAERRSWLGGDNFSIADIAAGAQLSALDYLDDVPWSEHEAAKDWYARIKSRPSFRPLLADHIPGVKPPKHYADLDF